MLAQRVPDGLVSHGCSLVEWACSTRPRRILLNAARTANVASANNQRTSSVSTLQVRMKEP